MSRFEEYVTQAQVKDFGPFRAPLVVTRKATIEDVIAKMAAERTGCVLVIDEGSQSAGQFALAGIFTERDLLRRVLGAGKSTSTPVGDVMTPDPDTISPDDTILSAIRTMHEGCHRHLPVVENGKPVSVISSRSLIRHIAELFPAEVYNLPPELGQKYYEAEGA